MQAQPYRRGGREPGAALAAMLAGRPVFLPNPMDLQRRNLKRVRRGQDLAAALLQGRR